MMAVSFNGLWKLLIEKDVKKVDLQDKIGMGGSMLAKNEPRRDDIYEYFGKIWNGLDCDFGDIVNY